MSAAGSWAVAAALSAAALWPSAGWAQPSPAEAPSASADASEPPAADADPGLPPAYPGQPPPTPEPGMFDISGRVGQAVDEWLRGLIESVMEVPLDLLAETLLATPQVSGPGRVRELWAASAAIANGFYVLLVVIGGIVVAGHESLQTRYTVKEIAPRLVVGMVVSNLSLAAAGVAITAANALSAALMSGRGVDAAAVAVFLRRMLHPVLGYNLPLWVALAVAVLLVVLLLTCVLRIALVILLVAAAPLALACHALPHTEGLALLWWRSFGACLGTQVGQALTMITGIRVFFSSEGRTLLGQATAGGLVDLLVLLALLSIMVRIPVWAGRVVFSGRGGRAGRYARNYVIFRLVRKAVAKI